MIVTGIKYRFFPTEEQKKILDGMFGARRFFWNKILEKYLSSYEKNKEIKKYNETSEEKKELIPYNLLIGSHPNTKLYNVDSIIEEGLKYIDENGESSPKDYSWLRSYPLGIYVSTVTDLGLAWKRFFEYIKKTKKGEKGLNKCGKPKKRSKRKNPTNSISLENTSSLCDGKLVINWKNNTIKTPGFRKLGICHCDLHKRFKGRVKRTTISKDIDGSYYISLTVEQEGEYPTPNGEITKDNTVGIDFGLKTFATITNADDSENGRKINPTINEKLSKLAEEIKKLQRKRTKCSVTFTRKDCDPKTMSVREMNKKIQENKNAFNGWHKEFSKGYEKYSLRIAKLQVKINNIKKNYIENFASSIVKDNNVNAVSVETLGIRDMTIKNKTRENEGKKISKKAKFRRAMARKFAQYSIGKSIEQLEYDCKKEGKYFIKADRKFASTKTCSVCGYKLQEIGLEDRKWICPKCGTEHDRDMNAAKNLAVYGYNKLKEKKIQTESELEVAMAESAN